MTKLVAYVTWPERWSSSVVARGWGAVCHGAVRRLFVGRRGV